MRSRTRQQMIDEDLLGRDIHDRYVIDAMGRIDRSLFVPGPLASEAYEDQALPIGPDATISQPYIVALMTQLARVRPGFRVLEVGTGSGYQAAVCADIGARVHSVELDPDLARRAREALARAGYDQVYVQVGDGYAGLPDHAPYDVILVTAAPLEVPPALLEQLDDEGRLVVPVGGLHQVLTVITRDQDDYETRRIAPVAFVPLRPG